VKKKKEASKRNNFDGRNFATNELATSGYWASPVQKVVKKWAPKIGIHCCQQYVDACSISTFPGHDHIDVQLECDGHINYVIELLGAMRKVWSELDKPVAWLLHLTTGGDCTTEYRALSFVEIQERIIRQGGPKFSTNALAVAANKLKLSQ
jgi:hypothetical protein